MIAYFDCFSGISGDMTLGALTDLGVPLEWLKEKLAEIPLEGFDISIKKELRQGIHAKRVHVSVAADLPSRTYADIRKLIQNSRLPTRVKETALAVFDKVAAAEAKIHHELKDQIHFHEVGALDSIIDIVGTALCIDYLGIDKIFSSKIPLGKGFVSGRHGVLPVPAPATVEILKHIPVYGSGIDQELVTPTGAAIIAALADGFCDLPAMKIEKIGYGAGQRDNTPTPNLLRIIKGVEYPESDAPHQGRLADPILVVETCIDDMNPEFYGHIMDRLFEDGALDVYWIPVFMKKNRPGTMIQVLCRPEMEEILVRRIMTETSTSGIRSYRVGRYALQREITTVKTAYGDVDVKKMIDPDGKPRMVPEYEVCRKIALSSSVPLQEVYSEVARACRLQKNS